MFIIISLIFCIFLIKILFFNKKKSGFNNSKKNTKNKQLIVIVALGIFVFILTNILISNDMKSYYYLTEDKCITIWKSGGEDVYVVFEKYKSNKLPVKNYLKTSLTNALTIIIDDSSEYDYVFFNNYGREVLIEKSDYKIKYYDYNQRDSFIENYYIDNQIKSNLKYLKIDIKEDLVIINGIKQ